MSARLGVVRWLLPAAVVAAAGVGWWHWTAGEPESPEPSAAAPPDAAAPPPEQATAVEVSRPDGDGQPAESVAAEPEPPPDRLWEAVKSVCPWPPLPSSWQVLDEPCLSAMNRLKLDENLDGAARGWREVLADPLATRRAVAEALDRLECRVPPSDDWPGETRPDLGEACAAEAMLRLASLQDKCVERLHTDWERVFASSLASIDRVSESQEEYYRWVESSHDARAHIYWETYMCRTVPPEAFEWIETLPEPPGDPTAHRYNRPPITQALDLYDAARRLGAEIPDWAMGRLELIAEIERRREQGLLNETEGTFHQ